MDDGAVAVWVKHQLAADAMRQVLPLLDAHGIDVLPVKGIVLAYRLYPSIENRPMADVDVRVRPRDLGRVARLARGAGWSVRTTSRQLGTLEFNVSKTLVEVETTIGPPGVCKLSVDEMLRRSRWCTGALAVRHREPEINDHALLLCINAFKDKLVLAPPWARQDLLRIARLPEFSITLLAKRAQQARVCTLLSIVAEWLSTAPDSENWRRVADRVRPMARRGYAILYSSLVRQAPASPILSVVARAASDSLIERCRAVALGSVGTFLALRRGRDHLSFDASGGRSP
ncbi:MAG TPA: nucleotidyltransferase family protein [Polyangiaceae bacterium]